MNGDPTLERIAQGNGLALCAAGSWIARFAPDLEQIVADAEKLTGSRPNIFIDVSQVSKLDTFGAWLIERLRRSLTQGGIEAKIAGLSANYSSLVDEVRRVKADPPREATSVTITGMLDQVGRSMAGIGATIVSLIDMLGAVLAASARVMIHPSGFRLTSTVHHLEQVCWRAVPIVVLITFLIGCIISQQGIFHFRKFGADIFVVDMLGVLVLREIGVLLVAIMVAGRSGSAYTAELGSMKMREEIDALRTMGFDPIEVLILPRMLALVIALPILAFLGAIAALYGGGLVAWLYGGVDPEAFLLRLRDAISIDHFTVGIIKAPVMAAVIGIVACVEGLGGAGQRRVARAAHHVLGGEGDFLRHRHGWRVRDLLRVDRNVTMAPERSDAIIRVRDITVQFGSTKVLDGLNLDVKRGEILGFVGPSGAGKSVLTRTIIGLVPKIAGRIEVFGVDLDAADAAERRGVERRWGILFQQGALFSSLSVRQNIQFPVREYLNVSQRLLDEITVAKLGMVGLAPRSGRPLSLGTVRRHDQARGAGARAGARSGTGVPR